MKTIIRRFAAPAALMAGLTFAAAVFAQAPMPEQKTQGSVAYLNGGIGDGEVQYIKHSMKDYSMALVFARAASPKAEYIADAAVTVKDHKGNTVFEAPAVGPYLLLKLPAGSYAVTATYHGHAQTRTVSAGKAAPVTFEWK